MKGQRYRECQVALCALVAGFGMATFSQVSRAEGATDDAASAGSTDVLPVDGGAEPNPADPVPRRASVKNRVIEEIVVTAQKREENIQEVPIAIQAFGGEALAARGIENTNQLGQTVPSLTFSDAIGFTLIYMRGIGTDAFIPSADPSIATYIDGIYLPASQATTQSLGNIERVEVLKGPQGTLFGRNSTGGAISITTETPGHEFKTSVQQEFGRLGQFSTRVSATLPMAEWISLGVSGLYSGKDSFYSNPNFDTQADRTRAFRAKLFIQPLDNLSLSFTAFQSRSQGLGSLIGNNTDPSALGRIVTIQPTENDYSSVYDYYSASQSEQKVYYGSLNWELPWVDVKLLGSDVLISTPFGSTDFDGSDRPLVSFQETKQYTDLNTAELQILSNANTWGSEKFKWVTGLYYFESTGGLDPAIFRVAPQLATSLLAIGAGTLGLEVPGLRNQINSLFTNLGLANIPLGPGGVTLNFRGLLDTTSYSAYAQGTYFFNEQWDLTLGGRYQEEERALVKSSTGLADFNNDGGETTLLPFPLDSQTVRNFSPKAVLSYHPSDDVMLYGSYAVGFKSGTYNIVNIYTPSTFIKPEQVKSYELGMKSEFLNGLLRLNGALFWNEISDLQSGFVSLLSGGAVRFQTAGSARTRGAEFDGTWIPFPNWNDGLVVTGNAAYVDAEYTDFKDGAGFRKGSGLYSANLDFTGNQIVRSPKFSGGLGLIQTIEVGNGSVEMAVDGYYNSGFYYDAYNTVKESAYSTVGARTGYLYNPWGLRMTVFINNLLDERYNMQVLQTDFGVNKTLAAPREYGVRLNWSF